ncbi:MAG: NAD(P)/FAD-dependent oxidoreductase [Bacteroidetes bacterium]|nr:NAD(P)/FAD-dependent oxidoreductase [Bacteroidota bacterium]
MSSPSLPRRDFLRLLAATFAAPSFDWDSMPHAARRPHPITGEFDAIIIGSGLGGLSCAAAFARQGFKPLVVEQHDKPGGYATAFNRPGGFRFDVSLHSTSVGERDGIANLINGFPEISGPEFLLHPTLFRAIYPDHDLQVAQKDLPGFVASLIRLFPEEQEGISGLFDDMAGLGKDIRRLSEARGQVDMTRFPVDFPNLARLYTKTWGDMVSARIREPKLRALLSSQWGYYGLPPSRLSCFYYALPFLGYLMGGGYYPKGRSQDISDAFVRFIEAHGGQVLLNTAATGILMKGEAAVGVATTQGEFTSKVVVSNADAHQTFLRLLPELELTRSYVARWKDYSVSLSCFQVFLGLNEEIVQRSGITDSEIFLETTYDPDEAYGCMLNADVERVGLGVSLYDNISSSYSPAGKNTVNILALQGFGPWEKFEKDYRAGNKSAYRKEKERMAGILIDRVEDRLLPGLSKAIVVKEIGTPLTNMRYTGHHRGAIYGWDQTVNNSGNTRVGHATPVKNLYLAGAWSRPGHGYGAVIPSGLECFGEIMREWK